MGWRRELIQLSSGGFAGKIVGAEFCGLQAADEWLSRGAFHIGPAAPGGLTLGVARACNGETSIWNAQKVCGDTILCAFWLFVPWSMLGRDVDIRDCVAEQKDGASLCLKDERLAAKLRACVWRLRLGSERTGAGLPSIREEMIGIAGDFVRRYVATGPCLGARGAHAMRILHVVRRYLRNNVGESISLLDLCDAASTSERTIRNASEIITGESPIAFLRAMRLNQVRRELLNASNPVRVTEIGMRCGFLHMPQFSKDYRHLFGELPSATIRRQLAHYA
jgi:AraC family transcriptional regulator, ethanolamine operon transcriptional activator